MDMKKIDILKEQIAELEKLVLLKDQRIHELESRPMQPMQFIPYVVPQYLPTPTPNYIGDKPWQDQITCTINPLGKPMGGTMS